MATKLFNCNTCKAAFSEKGNLKKHVASIHKNTNEYCEAPFLQNKGLKRIKATLHKSKIISTHPRFEPTKNENQCLICKLEFKRATHLTVHNALIHCMILVLQDICQQ